MDDKKKKNLEGEQVEEVVGAGRNVDEGTMTATVK